jgi:hypothetical protein
MFVASARHPTSLYPFNRISRIEEVAMDSSRGGDESWRQQQQHQQAPRSTLPGGSVSPLLSWQQQQQQSQLPPLQEPMQQRAYDYAAPTLPLPMQNPYPSPSLAPMQYQQQPPHISYSYDQQQQRYNLPYASYSPRPQPLINLPAAGGLPSLLYPPGEHYYADQLPSPLESSRHLSIAVKEPHSSSSSPRVGSSSGLPLSLDDSARWSGYSTGQRVYPSGLVGGHRGSYSTMSSGSSTSRSPTQPIAPQSSHHHHQQYSSSSSSSIPYQDISATSMIMPPPNPPLEARMPIEPEMQRRAATACNFCRARKLRCDGSAPCRQCARRDLECVFSNTNPAKRRRREQGRDDEGDGDSSSSRRDISQSMSGRRGSSSYEVRSSSSSSSYPTKRRSERQDETEPRRRQSKAGVEISKYSENIHTSSNSSLPCLPPDLYYAGEKNYCRPHLPLQLSPIWQQQQQGRGFA